MKAFKELSWRSILLALLASLFLGSFLWSIVFESLLPLWRARDLQMLYRNLIGIPIIFIGLGIFIWGALRFIRDTYTAMSTPEVRERIKQIRSRASNEGIRRASKENFLALLHAWKPGALLIFTGYLLLAIGGRLIN